MIRVLVVEDDPHLAEAHRAYVERVGGFEVARVVQTGRDAIRTAVGAVDGGAPIDLVLMDIGLPDISGLEVAAAMARLRPRPDVIAITSARHLEMVRAAVAHGVALYLLKPFPFASLRDRLERYLEFRSALPTDNSALTQQDIDRAFSALRTPDPKATAPKGIAPQTLEEISQVVRASVEGLSATEVGHCVGVSRVTAWRYLEQLAAEGAVKRRTDYGRAGRPQVRYIWHR
ncbi:MAG: response regulator [Mycobacterium sp.]|nr:response regulator [Mycobacterium sp.]